MGSGDRYCYRNGVIKFEKSDALSLVRKKNKLFVLGEQRKKIILPLPQQNTETWSNQM